MHTYFSKMARRCFLMPSTRLRALFHHVAATNTYESGIATYTDCIYSYLMQIFQKHNQIVR